MLFVIMLLMLNGCKKAAEKQAQTLIGQESGIAQGQQDVPPEGGAEPGVVEDVPPPEEAPIPTEGVIIADVPPPEESSAVALERTATYFESNFSNSVKISSPISLGNSVRVTRSLIWVAVFSTELISL